MVGHETPDAICTTWCIFTSTTTSHSAKRKYDLVFRALRDKQSRWREKNMTKRRQRFTVRTSSIYSLPSIHSMWKKKVYIKRCTYIILQKQEREQSTNQRELDMHVGCSHRQHIISCKFLRCFTHCTALNTAMAQPLHVHILYSWC